MAEINYFGEKPEQLPYLEIGKGRPDDNKASFLKVSFGNHVIGVLNSLLELQFYPKGIAKLWWSKKNLAIEINRERLADLVIGTQAFQEESGGGALLIVKSVHPGRLVCRRWNGEEEGEEDIDVAMPWELRGDLTYWQKMYATISDISAGTQEFTVTKNGDEEVWRITPDYAAGVYIRATRIAWSGVTVGSGEDEKQVTMMDNNISGRAFAEVVD